MEPRQQSALLWGAVGFMSFLVLVQGYALFREPLVSIMQGFTVAVGVGIGTATLAYLLEYRVAAWSTKRAVRTGADAESDDE